MAWVELLEGLEAGDQILVDGSLGRVAKVVPTSSAETNLANASTNANKNEINGEPGDVVSPATPVDGQSTIAAPAPKTPATTAHPDNAETQNAG